MDMDGTLWRGATPLPGLAAWFDFLAARRLPYVLATNNAHWPPEHYVPKLAGFGVAIAREAVLTSATAAAEWLRGYLPVGARVHVVGSAALAAALTGAGFAVSGRDRLDREVAGAGRSEGEGIVPGAGAGSAPVAAVVAGVDFELTYAKIRDAARLIRAGAWFVGTNPDTTFPTEDGLSPGAGTVLAALAAASGVAPTIVGKPEPPMFDLALARLGTRPEQTLMVGDRLDTDILGGRRAGLQTAFLTTGVDGPDAVTATGITPGGVFEGLDGLRSAWNRRLAGS